MDTERTTEVIALDAVETEPAENGMPKIEEPPDELKGSQPTREDCSLCRENLAEITSHISGNNRPLTPAGWIGVNLCMLIPPLNLLLLFLWACGGTERTNLKNYARGVLLTAVLLTLAFLIAVVILDLCGLRFVYPAWVDRVFS